VTRLSELAAEHDLSYTIHLPLDTQMGSADESIRRKSVDACLRIIERFGVLNPFAYVLHFHGDPGESVISSDMERWLAQHRRSVQELLGAVDARDICVETLSYPYELIHEIVFDFGLSVCLDIGHILLCDYSVEEYLKNYFDRTRIMHLHGVEGKKDHTDLSHLSPDLLDLLIDKLSEGQPGSRVLTVEVFGEQEFTRSMEVLSNRYVKR